MINTEKLNSESKAVVDRQETHQYVLSVPAFISMRPNFNLEGFPIENIPRTLDIFKPIPNGIILVDCIGNGGVFDITDGKLSVADEKSIAELSLNKDALNAVSNLLELEISQLTMFIGIECTNQDLTIKARNGTGGVFVICRDGSLKSIYYKKDESLFDNARDDDSVKLYLDPATSSEKVSLSNATYHYPLNDVLAVIMTTDGVEDIAVGRARYGMNTRELALSVSAYLLSILNSANLKNLSMDIDIESILLNVSLPIDTANDDATILFHVL